MARLYAAAFAEGPGRAWSAAEFSGLLASPHVFALGDVRGFALVRTVLTEAELLTIAVLPELQNRGLGRDLMRRWHLAAAARGAEIALLEVAADNGPARALYTRMGYTETGRRRAYYPGGADAVLMQHALTKGQP